MAAPVAVITLSSDLCLAGAIVRLDASLSTADAEIETWTWEVAQYPKGAKEPFILSSSEQVAYFSPIHPGRYVISLVVETSTETSSVEYKDLYVQLSSFPHLERTTPAGTWPYRVLSDFWKVIEGREALETLWSGYTQIASTDLLRAWQVRYENSIRKIPEFYRRNWLAFDSKLPLNGSFRAVYHESLKGTAARTPSTEEGTTAIVLSSQEIRLLAGSPIPEAIGRTLEVTNAEDAVNEDVFTVRALSRDGSGYLLSSTTPLGNPEAEQSASGSDGATVAGSDVFSAASVNFSTAGVAAGHILRLDSGDTRGFYEVEAVGVSGGLSANYQIRLTQPILTNGTSIRFTVFRPVEVSVPLRQGPFTNKIYISTEDVDLTPLLGTTVTGRGTVRGPYELLVEKRHVSEGFVGKSIQVVGGLLSGSRIVISGINEARTGYLTGTRLLAAPGAAITYQMVSPIDVSDYVIVVDGETYPVLSFSREDGTPIENGGMGPFWAVTLQDFLAPADRTGLVWEIPSVLVGPASDDYPPQGVSRSDNLAFTVRREDNQTTTTLPCRVVGSWKNKIGFDIGSEDPGNSDAGVFSDSEITAILNDLGIPRSYETTTGDVVRDSVAAQILQEMSARRFETETFNFPLLAPHTLTLAGLTFVLRPAFVRRNRLLPVDSSIHSIPVLTPYIDTPATSRDDASGLFSIYHKDGTVSQSSFVHDDLVENDSFILQHETYRGRNATTAANDGTLTLDRSPRDLDFRVGDRIELKSGRSQGVYYITDINDTTVIIQAKNGEVPSFADDNVDYEVTRKLAGSFINTDNYFYTEAPAPDRLWAPAVFFKNTQAIEDNFGRLVGITETQLENYGVQQISFKGAVSALMYCWTLGPTVRAVNTGIQVLLGLPVTEVLSKIVSITSVDDGTDQVILEDLTSDLQPLGTFRMFQYLRGSADSFYGLATNPVTGLQFGVGDVIEPFTPLTNGVLVEDELKRVGWWSGTHNELAKFHSWQVRINTQVVDSRDVSLVTSFLDEIRPIETRAYCVLVVPLTDTVTITDDLFLAVTNYLYDEPSFSIPSTRMLDASFSSLSLRRFDRSSISSRILFQGNDLTFTSGSSSVVSARGWFTSSGSPATLSHASGENTYQARWPNAFYDDISDTVTVRGTNLVRVGDVLNVVTGPNSGRYSITGITNNTTLVVAALSPEVEPRTMSPSSFEASSDDVFYVERYDANPLVTGTASFSSGGNTLTQASGNFRWNGVVPGDWAVLLTSERRVARITEVTDTTLRISGVFASTGTTSFRVERDALLTNPIVSGTDGETTNGDPIFTSAAASFDLRRVRPGDVLLIGEAEFRILSVLSATELYVDRSFTSTATGLTFEVRREHLDTTRDSDTDAERYQISDQLELVLYHPVTSVTTITDGEVTGFTLTSATDLEGAGVTEGMFAQVDAGKKLSLTGTITLTTSSTALSGSGTAFTTELEVGSLVYLDSDGISEMRSVASITDDDTAVLSAAYDGAGGTGAGSVFVPQVSCGVYTITSVITTDVEVAEEFPDPDTGLHITFFEEDSDFSVENDTVTSLAATDFEVLGVRPGDVFSSSLGEIGIVAVAGDTLTLASTTGISPAVGYVGRVVRRIYE